MHYNADNMHRQLFDYPMLQEKMKQFNRKSTKTYKLHMNTRIFGLDILIDSA